MNQNDKPTRKATDAQARDLLAGRNLETRAERTARDAAEIDAAEKIIEAKLLADRSATNGGISAATRLQAAQLTEARHEQDRRNRRDS